MISERWWIGKDLVGSGRGIILRHYPGIRLDGLRKTTNSSITITSCRGRESNPEPPEYEVAALIIRPRRSVQKNCGTTNLIRLRPLLYLSFPMNTDSLITAFDAMLLTVTHKIRVNTLYFRHSRCVLLLFSINKYLVSRRHFIVNSIFWLQISPPAYHQQAVIFL
jgi:hypothetical protein